MEKSAGTKLNVTIKSVYTLDKNKVGGIADVNDKNVYLFKDGNIAMCPFLSQIITDRKTGNHGMLPYPCGSGCHHFHIAPETQKIVEKDNNAKLVPTGRLRVGLSCGNGNVSFQISNVKIDESKLSSPSSPTESSAPSHLKVVKKEEEPAK